MDHQLVNFLIAEGEEGGRVDFKRELHLDTGEQKAEFIKDVISLANLPPGTPGYLLVGVDDAGLKVDCEALPKERIQQIVDHYVRPIPTVRCQMVAVQTPGVSIGVIEVRGDERPYRVAVPICDLKQDQVKVRHGAITVDASQEELRRMYEETERRGRIAGMVESAESYRERGRFREAIKLYSQVISVAHTAEMRLARAKVCSQFIIERKPDDIEAVRDQALEDYEDAIELAESTQTENGARFGRLRLCEHLAYYLQEWDEDVDWLEANTEGRELGEVLYLKWARPERTPYRPKEALVEISRAIELGYSTAKVYDLRATAHYNLDNYGSALEDLEAGLRKISERQQRAQMLEFQALLLVKVGRFKNAYTALMQAQSLSKTHTDLAAVARGIEDEILWRYGLAYQFGTPQESKVALASMLTQILLTYGENLSTLQWRLREVAIAIQAIARITIPDFWEEWYPRILNREVVLGWRWSEEEEV